MIVDMWYKWYTFWQAPEIAKKCKFDPKTKDSFENFQK